MDAETLRKLLELEEKNPGKLDEFLSQMESKEVQPPKKNARAQLRAQALNNLNKELGPGFTRFIKQDQIKKG